MKIAFYCCSNGYGHFHRTLQICSYLKDMSIDIYCEKYQYNRFKDNIYSFEFYRDKPKLNFIFYKSPNIRWDRKNNFSFSDYLKSIEESCVNIDKYVRDIDYSYCDTRSKNRSTSDSAGINNKATSVCKRRDTRDFDQNDSI